MCSDVLIIVYSFRFVIALSVLQLTVSDYPFSIYKPFSVLSVLDFVLFSRSIYGF